jgi:hypothetical protein
MTISAKIQAWVLAFAEYMIWMTNKRHILYILSKKRRALSKNTNYFFGNVRWGGNMSDYHRRTYGFVKEEFVHSLFQEEFRAKPYNALIKICYTVARRRYYENFLSDVQESIERLLEEKILIATQRPEGLFIREDRDLAGPILSPLYYPKVLLEYEPLRDLLGKAMKWSVILILGYAGLSGIIGKL